MKERLQKAEKSPPSTMWNLRNEPNSPYEIFNLKFKIHAFKDELPKHTLEIEASKHFFWLFMMHAHHPVIVMKYLEVLKILELVAGLVS